MTIQCAYVTSVVVWSEALQKHDLYDWLTGV